MSMASTSNQVASSCFPSSSSTPHWNHDVFLSFRGTDTRNNFTSHLYTALKNAGIKTFIDDEELPTGKEIKPELRKAIRESRMSIIVFSKNYASSRWCLDELVEIIECKRTMEQLVLPLFFDVKPSVVRHQTESYAEAFQHFVTESDKSKVENWRAALKEAADLSGHVLADEENGNEAKFIEKIVGKVQLLVNPSCLNVPEYLIGVDFHVNCINTLLSIGTDDVRAIGIYGMGGIGKTTVSKAVYNKHLNHFEGSAFVENIKDFSKLPDGLRRLQENLLNQLQKKEVKLKNSDEGINSIKKICCSRKVLILLDDLDDLNQVNQLAGQKSWFSTGSRVIMVTRDAKLLKEAQVNHDHMYEMKVLDEDKSLELFRRLAIGEETSSEDHISLSIDIARYCAGLPLALEVIGSHLRRENFTYWKNALKEFQSKPHKKIQDRLKISYDALSKDRKNIFLDVACFFIGWNTEYLVKFWDGCGFFAENSIKDLKNKCLLKVDEQNRLTMHDHLRAMGRAIVLEASDRSLEKQSRLWIHQEVCDLLQHPKGAEAKAVEGISLGLSNLQSITLETKAFEAMCELRLLLMNEVDVIGSFEHLFGKLRLLCWLCCPLKSLPTDFHPRKLVGLDLRYSNIEKLWEGVKHLNNLKILNLSYCESLVETPKFTGVRSLERLMLSYCNRLSTIDPSICELRSLEELDLEGCYNLERLPEELGNLECLLDLDLSCCRNLTNLPASIGDLRALKKLDVRHCHNLERLPEELGNLECLLDLDLSSCRNLTNLPASFGDLRALEKLDVHDCSNLKRLPKGMGNLKKLWTLDANKTGLEELPDSIGHLSSLVHLDLSECKNLKTLPTTIRDLRALKRLNFRSCSKLERLPEELGNLECLLVLDLRGCNNLTNLPASIGDLRALKELNLSYLKLERLPEELGNLECLLDLDLRWCWYLTNLPASICDLRALEKLHVYGCSNLKRLPEGMGNLKKLRTLDASITGLEGLPDSIGHLSSLVHLRLSECENLKTLPDCICDLSSLELLDISYCSGLQQLPDRLGNMVSLRNLTAYDIGCQQLPDFIKNLKKIESLSLSLLHGGSFKRFALPLTSSLERLELKYCGLHDKDIPDDIGIYLLSLRFLDLRGNDFCNLPSTLCQLSNLTELDLSDCKSLVSLPELPPNLEVLRASGCTAMRKKPNLSNLKRWRCLNLSDNSMEINKLMKLS